MGKKEIFVVCDNTNQYDTNHMLEIITKASLLSQQLESNVTAVCIGSRKEIQFSKLMEYGADRVLFCEETGEYNSWEICNIISEMIREKQPEVMFFPASKSGKALAAFLSTRFEAGLTADCIDVELDEEKEIYFSRAAMNDSVIAKIQCMNSKIKMCTIKDGVFIKQKQKTEGQGIVEIFVSKEEYENRKWLVEVLEHLDLEPKANVDISKASIVFCVGRGVQNLKTLELLGKIARRCGAEIIGTRAAVEEQLIQKERQVGQSGKSISPQIYVGFGVSGASQHMVGIKNAGIVIAVNHDCNAPIFNYADYRIIDDIDHIVYELEQRLNHAA